MQYTDVVCYKDLVELSREDVIKLYQDFIKNTEYDIRNSILMLPTLRLRFREYREVLRGLILGYHVRLYFGRKSPKIPGFDESDLELLLPQLEEIHKSLRLRRYKIIERIIITDMIFRLYYDLCEKYNFESTLSDFRELQDIVKNLTVDKASRYAVIERDYMPYDRHHGANVMNIHYPEALAGFKVACLPLLSWSGVLQLGMLQFFASGRWKKVRKVVSEIKDVEPEKIMTEPTKEFLKDCEYEFDKNIKSYITFVKKFIKEVESIIHEKDPIEEFILSCLPATFLELCDMAKEIGFDLEKIGSKLYDLVRRGVIKEEKGVFKVVK